MSARAVSHRFARILTAALALALALTLAPDARLARADHCDGANAAAILNQAIGQDSASSVVAPVPHPFPGCSAQWAAPQEQLDTRILWPGVTFVQPTYLLDLGHRVPTLTARLDGLGFANKITLTRTESAVGVYYLPAEWHRIPTGPVVAPAQIRLRIYRPGLRPRTKILVADTTFATPGS